MQQAGYHHAHMLANQLREDMDARNSDLMSVLQTALEAQSIAPAATATTTSTLTPQTHQVNAATTDKVQLEILQLLQQMQKDMQTTRVPAQATKARKGRKTPDDASFPRKKTDQYCWTHGACAHPSPSCNTKAQGHQDTANFKNRMGGSNAYCT